nr:hypothetical protein K4M19_00443 [Agrobacterium fabrum]
MVGAGRDDSRPRDDNIAILASCRHRPGRILALVRRYVDITEIYPRDGRASTSNRVRTSDETARLTITVT